MKKEIKISPSILAGDFGFLDKESKRIEASGADWLHIDIMDGHFVPNLTMGPQAVAAINRATNMFLDVHIMVYNPYDYIERLVEAGADMITFHFEATEEVDETLKYIKRCNIKAGLAFNPETSLSMIPKYMDKCDMILLMTVPPGYGGQPFDESVLDKIDFTRDLANKCNLPLDIQVDGGINQHTAAQCIKAGANVLVAGTYLFQSSDMAKAVKDLRKA